MLSVTTHVLYATTDVLHATANILCCYCSAAINALCVITHVLYTTANVLHYYWCSVCHYWCFVSRMLFCNTLLMFCVTLLMLSVSVLCLCWCSVTGSFQCARTSLALTACEPSRKILNVTCNYCCKLKCLEMVIIHKSNHLSSHNRRKPLPSL